MKFIFRHMTKLKIENQKLKLPLIFLIALALGSCAQKFPAQFIYEVDLDNQVCGRYKVVDSERLTFEHDSDLPLSSCNGVFGFSSRDISPVLNWTRDAIKQAKEKCQ